MTEPAKKPVRRRTSMPRREEPEDYKGGRVVVINTVPCGWCMTGYHTDCKHETSHYDRLWVCPCECNTGWVPQDLGSGEIFLDPPKKRAVATDDDEPEDDGQPSELKAKNGTVRRKPGR